VLLTSQFRRLLSGDRPDVLGETVVKSNRMSNSSALGLVAFFARLLRDRRANVAPMLALILVPLIGTFGVAGEVSSWYLTDRSMQNAADSAAIAAGTNGDYTHQDTGGDLMYQREAYAVAANYGFTGGVNNVQVAASTTTASPCPSGQTCFKVTIQKTVPLFLVGILGYRDTGITLNGSPAQLITSTAIATGQGGPGTPSCITALGQTGVVQDLTVNGGPNSNMAGCAVASSGDATCHGHAIGGTIASYAANGDTNDCAANGNDLSDPATPLADPIGSRPIPADPCGGKYPQEVNGAAATQNQLSSSYTGGGVQTFCGDVQLGTTTTSVNGKGKTVTTYTPASPTLTAGTVLVIYNGTLDIGSNTLTAPNTTIVFTKGNSGSNVSGVSYFPTGNGTLNLTAPTSGTWANLALYQDNTLTNGSGVDITMAGNSPTWNITGLIYASTSDITVSGDVGTNSACIGWVVATLRINGTGNIIDNAGSCAASGITLPGLGGGARITLIQ
jgi:Flp pilus assembly protein TadG